MPYAPFLPKPPPQPVKKPAPVPSGISQLSLSYPYRPDGLIPEMPEDALPTSMQDLDDYPYYNQMVSKVPGIARKIRHNAPLDPYHIFNEQEREQHQLQKPSRPASYSVNYATTDIENVMYPGRKKESMYMNPNSYTLEQHLPTMIEPQMAYRNAGNYNTSLRYSNVGLIQEGYKASDTETDGLAELRAECTILENELFLHKILVIILSCVVLMLIFISSHA